MYAPFAASNTVDFQHYCRETVTTDTVISCNLTSNLLKILPNALRAQWELVSHHKKNTPHL